METRPGAVLFPRSEPLFIVAPESQTRALKAAAELLAYELPGRRVQVAAAAGALAMSSEFLGWMRRNARFDFIDPKGGDSVSWIEAGELLRAELLAVTY
jgi:hypothetical protein